jgi:hypothetical protein
VAARPQLELGRTPTIVHALFPAPTHGAMRSCTFLPPQFHTQKRAQRCARALTRARAAVRACAAASSPLEAYNAALCLRALTDSADVARTPLEHTRAQSVIA